MNKNAADLTEAISHDPAEVNKLLADFHKQLAGDVPDDASIDIRIGADKQNNRVVVDLGKPTRWLSFKADECGGFIQLLIDKLESLGHKFVIRVG